MLSNEDNEKLTRVGRGTVMGDLMRRYWQPVLYSYELPEPDGVAVRVRLLGENLIAFRNTHGQVGLMEAHCPHRGAELFFGRNEDGGIRCVYHGWKFDITGRCVDMPNERPTNAFRDKVRTTAYQCEERGGVIWAYMGSGEPPELPLMEWVTVPDENRFLSKRYHECNWAQALEGDLDSSHVGLLHSMLNRDVPGFGFGQRPDGSYNTIGQHLQPIIQAEDTDFGMWVAAQRPSKENAFYWRASAFMLPYYTMIPPSGDGPIHVNIWQPMDDENTMVWSIQYHGARALRDDEIGKLKTGLYEHYGPDDTLPPTTEPGGRWRAKANRSNDFLIDRDAQRTTSFTGLRGFWRQDRAVVESMGPIYDREQEHLGASDLGIVRFRRLMLRVATEMREKGSSPPGLDPKTHLHRPIAAIIEDGDSWQKIINERSVVAPGTWKPSP